MKKQKPRHKNRLRNRIYFWLFPLLLLTVGLTVHQVFFAMSVNKTVASVADEDFQAVNVMKQGLQIIESIRMRSSAGVPYDDSLAELVELHAHLIQLAERNANLPPRYSGMVKRMGSLISVLEQMGTKATLAGTDLARIKLLIQTVADELSSVMVQTSEQMSDAFRDLRQKTVHSYAVMGVGSTLSFMLAFLISTLLSSKIARPIDRLYEATEEVAAGNLEVSLRVDSTDELGRLAMGFSHMIERLRYYRRINDVRLLRTLEALRSIMDRMPDVVLVVGETLEVGFKNPEAEQMLMHREFQEGFPEVFKKIIQEGFRSSEPCIRRQLDQAVMMRLSGEVRYFLIHTFPFEVVDLVSDETKPVENEIQEPQPGNTLAVMLQDVTAMQLSDRLKTDLVATVSHELKTPITSARMALYLLLEEQIGPLNDEQRTLATTARDDLERQLATIDHLLSFTRFESKGTPDPHQNTRVSKLLQECIHGYGPLAKTAEITISTDFAVEDLEIETDPNGLKVVVNNLLGNAIKYSPKNSHVKVSFEQNSEASNLLICVSDNGPGIAEDRMVSLFEPYTRGDHGVKVSGTGLGLNIAKNIVEGFGGRIWCESEVGSGTRFFVEIPLHTQASVETVTDAMV